MQIKISSLPATIELLRASRHNPEAPDFDAYIYALGEDAEQPLKNALAGRNKIVISRIFDDIRRIDDKRGKAPTQNDIDYFVRNFRELIENKIEKVHINCYAGVSRSTALAFILLRMTGLSNQKAWDQLELLAPYCYPNTLILKYADRSHELPDDIGPSSMEKFVLAKLGK
jgi:predicted protein tyrosine phosphatase